MTNLVYIAPSGPNAPLEAHKLSADLQSSGLESNVDVSGQKTKMMLWAAHVVGARFYIVIGDEELRSRIYGVKDLQTHEQWKIPVDEISGFISDRIKEIPERHDSEPSEAYNAWFCVYELGSLNHERLSWEHDNIVVCVARNVVGLKIAIRYRVAIIIGLSMKIHLV